VKHILREAAAKAQAKYEQ